MRVKGLTLVVHSHSRTAISIAHELARGARGRAESEEKAGGARDVRGEHCAGGREGREDRPSRGVVSRSTPHRARGMAPGLTDANACAILDGIAQHAREVIEDAGRCHESPGPPGGYGLPCRPGPGPVHDRPRHPPPASDCRRPAQLLPPPTQHSVLSLPRVAKCQEMSHFSQDSDPHPRIEYGAGSSPLPRRERGYEPLPLTNLYNDRAGLKTGRV